jgi:transcriptional regulator GlxA family with amidase domain
MLTGIFQHESEGQSIRVASPSANSREDHMGDNNLAHVSGGILWTGLSQPRAGQPARHRAAGRPHSLDPRIRHLETLMRRDLHRPFRLAEFAADMQISVSRLSHLFRFETGVSPRQYLKSVRLRQAMEFLEESSLSVKEVAARVGLDVSRLIKEFRETYGATPAHHRRLTRLRDLTSGHRDPGPALGRERSRICI